MKVLLALILGATALFSGGLSIFVVANLELRRALHLALAQRYRCFAPEIVIAGDSLAAGCPFRFLSPKPFGVLTVAKGGATLQEIAVQLSQVRGIAPRWIVFGGGLNDLLSDDSSLAQIEHDFRLLLRRMGVVRKATFTLMPHVADADWTARIDAANQLMGAICEQNGIGVLDLNPELSAGGVRRPEMTDDGLHFTSRANAVWIAALKQRLGDPIS